MKTLILVRHAKSSWKDRSLPDRLRPLNKRGRRDAPFMGTRLAERGVDVELMVSSPARRAIDTAEAMAEELEYPWDEIVTDERLYGADAEEILTVIEDQDDEIDALMLVGHNPGLHVLVNGLWGADLENLPTGGVVELVYDIARWEEVEPTKPRQVRYDYPKKDRR